MNSIKTLIVIFILASVVACSSSKTKKTSNETSTTSTTTTSTTTNDTMTTTEDAKMKSEGYTQGTIVFSDKADDCAYTIQLDGKDGLMYDPVNLDAMYQKHDAKIWFTFSPLRRMNRCVKANPIYITDIKKRS